MKPIIRSYLIELNVGNSVPGNNSSLDFSDYPALRKIYLCGVTMFTANSLARSPQGRPVVNTLIGTVITLLDDKQKEIIYKYPCFDLDPNNNAGFYRDFRPFPLELTKSSLQILDNTGINAGDSFLVNLFYFETKDAAKFLGNEAKPRNRQ